jgi:hypothetical protein
MLVDSRGRYSSKSSTHSTIALVCRKRKRAAETTGRATPKGKEVYDPPSEASDLETGSTRVLRDKGAVEASEVE